MRGNIKPAMHLLFLRGLLEMLARLMTWEHMQTRMKDSKPYLLNLVDLGEKGKEENKETKASVNTSTAMQCSIAHSKREKKITTFIQNIQQNMKTKRCTHQSPAIG